MNILCIGQVEDRTNIDEQILKQTIQPNRTIFLIDDNPAVGINNRRKRIADNHKKLQEYVEAYKPDLVFQVEGDSVLPENALERLLGHYIKNPSLSAVSGIQIGRHGLYCIGAWHIAEDRKSFKSVDYTKTGLQQVDAMGLYCYLSPVDKWLEGNCIWNDEAYGPDVNFFLSMPGDKYVDMDLHIGHKYRDGIIRPTDPSTCNAKFKFNGERWEYKQIMESY